MNHAVLIQKWVLISPEGSQGEFYRRDTEVKRRKHLLGHSSVITLSGLPSLQVIWMDVIGPA